MDDKQEYLRWLEEMWDIHKFDLPGRTEREEKRKEELLEMLKGLSEISERRINAPHLRRWEPSRR
jgi:hypothetical protein